MVSLERNTSKQVLNVQAIDVFFKLMNSEHLQWCYTETKLSTLSTA